MGVELRRVHVVLAADAGRPLPAAVAVSPVTDWYSERFGSNLGAWVGDFLDGEPQPSGGQYYDRSPVLFAQRRPHPHAADGGRCTTAPRRPTRRSSSTTRSSSTASRATSSIYPGEGHGVHSFPALIDCTTRVVAWFQRHMPIH